MRESTTYQAIWAEGRHEGRQEGRIEGLSEGERIALIRMGSRRFGEPDRRIRESIDSINSTDRFNLLIDRLLDVSSWEDLLQ